MKRSMAEPDHLTMANCLMLLSRSSESDDSMSDSPNRVFECKTCNRQFSSFQALGGHRASHKKPRLIAGGDVAGSNFEIQLQSPAKPKSHECSICGLEFAIGQALGGHMRRHRAETAAVSENREVKSSDRRVFWLDLNLTPYENDLEFRFGKRTPIVDCFL